MCRSVSEGGRRCACNQQLANDNRRLARSKRNLVAANAASIGGVELGEAVRNLPPSRMTAFVVAAGAASPDMVHKLTNGIDGNLPGIHNMVTEDRRETASEFGKANNSGKFDQHAIAEVQKAVLEFDKARLNDMDPRSDDAAKLRRSCEVRGKAIELGLLNGETMTLKRAKDLSDEQRSFLANLNPEDIPSLTEVAGRVSRSYWDRHLAEANFVTEPRTSTPGLRLRDEHGVPKSLGALLAENPGKNIKLAEDLILSRGDNGEVILQDHATGTHVSAAGTTRAMDAIARMPRVVDVKLPDKASSMSQRLIDHKYLDPETRSGRTHRKTLMAAATQAMYNSGVPVNNGQDGKAAWQNHIFLANAGMARPSFREATPRIEGYEMDGFSRAALAIRDEEFAKTAKNMGVSLLTDKKTLAGSTRSEPDARYSGPVPREQRDAAERGGFRIRSQKASSPERDAVLKAPVAAFSVVAPDLDRQVGIDTAIGSDLSRKVGDANRVIRYGHNPETVGERPHIAKMALADAFRARKLAKPHAPTVINTTATLPSRWDGDGDFLDTVFKPGARVDTKGYTEGTVNGSASDKSGGGACGPRQYKVQYISTGHLVQAGGDAVIADGAPFRVHSIDRSGAVPVVRMIQDDLAADLAAGAITL